MAVELVGVLMIKREMVEYADMEMYASWRMERYVCRSRKSVLHCTNDQWGLAKPTPEQIREMYLSTREQKGRPNQGGLFYLDGCLVNIGSTNSRQDCSWGPEIPMVFWQNGAE